MKKQSLAKKLMDKLKGKKPPTNKKPKYYKNYA